METWLLADPEALEEYYNQGFNSNAVPRRMNLEEESKAQVYAAFELATRQTQKGSYGKIKHGSELLKRVSSVKARERCPHCERFFNILEEMIQA
jgi:CRISPR/Cas system CSM-associated protein Csm2 small subunit